MKVDRQLDVDGVGPCPGGLQGVAGDRLAKPAQTSAVGGGHHAGDVVLAGLQAPRADQSRDIAFGVRIQLAGQGRAIGRCHLRHCLRMRPQPGLVQIRQLDRGVGAVLSAIDGSGRPPIRTGRRRLGALDHDQHQPGPQVIGAVGVRRREQPGKVGRVEIDDRQVVRLEVRDVGLRIGADHQPGVDSDDVGGTVERRNRRCRTRPSRQSPFCLACSVSPTVMRGRTASGPPATSGLRCARASPRRDQGAKR